MLNFHFFHIRKFSDSKNWYGGKANRMEEVYKSFLILHILIEFGSSIMSIDDAEDDDDDDDDR